MSIKGIGNERCRIDYLLENKNDTALYRHITKDDVCLGKLMDSIPSYILINKRQVDDVYRLLSRLFSTTDGGPSEIISLGTYDVFMQNPSSFLRYVSNNNDKNLESILLNELCMDIGKDERFATKTAAINFLCKYKKQSKVYSAFMKNFIKKFREMECQ